MVFGLSPRARNGLRAKRGAAFSLGNGSAPFEGLELGAASADSCLRVRRDAVTVSGNFGLALLHGLALSAGLWYLLLFAVLRLA